MGGDKDETQGMTIIGTVRARKAQSCYFVYLLASLSGTLYVGLTDNLPKRMNEHKEGLFDGFTRKYKVNRLMYLETFTDSTVAANREKQVKKWRREKKIGLFAKSNPQWRDLTPEIRALIGVPRFARDVTTQ
ncbi:MAG TPA: GIY-YIG nuclease family protein [Candidatus Angelobacter sp.]|nr:GIY-YIG nuclease family protein [Candidatus Angelobacter sp.]